MRSCEVIDVVKEALVRHKRVRISHHQEDQHIVDELCETFGLRGHILDQRRSLFGLIRRSHNESGGMFRGKVYIRGNVTPAWYLMTNSGKILRHVDGIR